MLSSFFPRLASRWPLGVGMSALAHLVLEDGTVRELFGSCTLGRHPSNQVALANDHVGRHHALIQWQQAGESDGGGYQIVDLGSANGTVVNGRRVSRPVPLKDGDVIDLGGSRLVFHTDAIGTTPADSLGSTVIALKTRMLWLMVADIIGSTRRAQELPGEEVARTNGNWFKTSREMIEAADGHMNQYLGDGFLCYWDHDDGSKSHLRALLKRFDGLRRTTSPPFRVVLHLGKVVLGSVPTLSALNLHGPEVNFVFRMEKVAAGLKEGILLSAAAAEGLSIEHGRRHEAELAGYDGKFPFLAPDFGD